MRRNSCNLKGVKEKLKTLMRIKGKLRSLVPSFLIKLSQVLSHDVGRVWLNHVKSSCYFSFALVLLFYFTSFFLGGKYYILPRLRNVKHSLRCTTVGVIVRLLVCSQPKWGGELFEMVLTCFAKDQ